MDGKEAGCSGARTGWSCLMSGEGAGLLLTGCLGMGEG